MSAMEITLIIVGAVIFLLGFLLPAKKKDMDEEVALISEDEIRKLIAKEVDDVKEQISDVVDETITYSMEKAERTMEKVSNEKIMAVGEYSDTVLEQINKNHKEVVFLYDMLNDKHDNLLSTIADVTKTADEIRQNVRDAEITAQEAAKKVMDAQESAGEFMDRIMRAEQSVKEAQIDVENAVRTVMRAVEETDTDLDRLHDAKPYHEEVLEEVSNVFADDEDDKKPEEQDAAVTEEAGAEQETDLQDAVSENAADDNDEQEFKPIAPKRVKIIHQPDGDYVDAPAEDISTSAAFAEMGIFGSKDWNEPAKTADDRNSTKGEETPNVDIQFAQGKDNGRNSNERILELHKAGKSNMAIAKELGLGIGEVKLVIDLFEGV